MSAGSTRAAPVVRCLAFDFDGTLVDSNAIKRGSYFEVLRTVPGSREVIEAVLAREPGADRHGVLAAVHAQLCASGASGLPPVGDWVEAYSRLCEEQVIACAEIPGALAALDALAPEHSLYIASATPEDALIRVVAGRGWTSRFAALYGGPRSKVENLERIVRREGIGRDEVVYVGDGAVDRRAAEEFGCAFYGFETPVGALPTGRLAPLASLLRGMAQRASAG